MGKNIAILGGGNTAYSCAADLTLRGHTVVIFSHLAHELTPIREKGGIEVTGAIEGFAKIDHVASDIKDALEATEIALITVTAEGFEAYAHLVVPHLHDNQVVVTFGKGGGSLIFARVIKDMGIEAKVALAEGNTALYACRHLGEAKVRILAIIKKVIIGAFPGKDTLTAIEALQEIYPNHEFSEAANVLEAILVDYNSLSHPPPTICNAALIERSVSGFRLFSEEANTPAVVNVIGELDKERLALSKALDIPAVPFEEEIYRVGFNPEGKEGVLSLYEAIHTEKLANLEGPFTLKARHLTEDIPYGLVVWCALGEMLGVPTPVSRACCVLASALNQEDYFSTGNSLEKMGIDPSWSVEQLKTFLRDGEL